MKKIFILSAISLFSASASFAGAYNELSSQQQASVQNGQQVFLKNDLSDSSWPEMKVYQRIDSTPEEAAALLWNVKLAPTFMTDVQVTQITKENSPSSMNVLYTVTMPIVGSDTYTVTETVSQYDNGGSYEIVWHKFDSKSAKSIDVVIRFETLGTGTLLAYDSQVVPDSFFAGMIEGSIESKLQNTVSQALGQMQKERTSKTDLLNSQVEALRTALGEKN
jgi:hypothetical protein